MRLSKTCASKSSTEKQIPFQQVPVALNASPPGETKDQQLEQMNRTEARPQPQKEETRIRSLTEDPLRRPTLR